MTLRIYQEADPSSAFSQSGLMTHPFRASIDGRLGGVVETLMYVRNDDPTTYYSGINVFPVDNNNTHIIDGTNGFVWKLNPGYQQPLDQQWSTITPANTITIPAIGGSGMPNTTSYIPFWLRVEVPAGANIGSFDGVVIRLTASGFAV
jgi:hypothetical protein